MTTPCDASHAPAGDVAAALIVLDALNRDFESSSELDALIADGDVEPQDVLAGLATLIYTFITVLNRNVGDTDALHSVVPAVITRLRGIEYLQPEAVAMMAGAMTAACLGLSPNLWREQYGKMRPIEYLPWTFTAWLLADLIDTVFEQPGYAINAVTALFTTSD